MDVFCGVREDFRRMGLFVSRTLSKRKLCSNTASFGVMRDNRTGCFVVHSLTLPVHDPIYNTVPCA